MEMIEGWDGASACALQAALRLSNQAFAARLRIGVRTVAGWHQKPAMRPRPEMQRLLDTVLSQASAEARDRFAVLTGEPAVTTPGARAGRAVRRVTGDHPEGHSPPARTGKGRHRPRSRHVRGDARSPRPTLTRSRRRGWPPDGDDGHVDLVVGVAAGRLLAKRRDPDPVE